MKPVTSYFAKEKQRFTMILPYQAKLKARAALPMIEDSSIDQALWLKYEDITWSEFAPANRLILFEHFRSKKNHPKIIPTVITTALKQCEGWKVDSGI